MNSSTAAQSAGPYLVVFYLVIIVCIGCVAFGAFQLVRYFVRNRGRNAETQIEFDRLRARLAGEAAPLTDVPEIFDPAVTPEVSTGPLQGQELLQTEGGKQALALLKVSGTVAMSDRFWVRQEGLTYVFTKSPELNRAPAWLVRTDTEKVEAVPSGFSVEQAVSRMNSGNSQATSTDSSAP